MRIKKQIKEIKDQSNMACELTAKYTKRENDKVGSALVTKSSEVANYLRAIWDTDTLGYREEFVVLILNRGNKVIAWSKVGVGGVAGVICDPKVIFSMALISGGSAIILAHNHPSGILKPSTADKQMTEKMVQAGKVLDIQVLDHIILTENGYLSFQDEYLMN